ncbi:aminoglycoside 6'-N-acetyltransferase [Chitinophaga rhizophila]|uniref:Aminoglycoside N(6')-acetyltransferase type 1 n=1 Tax=Chitinophaga rhizophila TaxID=2866212 RepID=A0ABS7GDL1_9BACT|nr:aminoglycoside 6'-N-acetyltransferase [Chitinophaga rhizophila]MBW8684752.1 GNAT family N-acetyltransferase [Chitinophaga rhizophila]
MDKFEIEEISKDNLRNLAALFVALWPECNIDEEYDECARILHSDDDTCFLVRASENDVAFIHVAIRRDYVEGALHSPTGYIEGLFVKEDFRNAGLSRLLLDLAEKWSKQKNCTQIASDTEVVNTDSINFHKKVGFEEVNRVMCFIKNI